MVYIAVLVLPGGWGVPSAKFSTHSAIVFIGPLGLSNLYVSITSHLEKSADHVKLIVDNNIKYSKVKKVIDFNALIKQAQYWENNSAVYNLKLI